MFSDCSEKHSALFPPDHWDTIASSFGFCYGSRVDLFTTSSGGDVLGQEAPQRQRLLGPLSPVEPLKDRIVWGNRQGGTSCHSALGESSCGSRVCASFMAVLLKDLPDQILNALKAPSGI